MKSPMFSEMLTRPVRRRKPSICLENGSKIAVVGGGPAGSFFSYFALDLAERLGIDIHVDIYEPRDFSLPAPQGCNMCAGVISETLLQNLAIEGIILPATIVQKAINSYVLHTDLGDQQIFAPRPEKRIAALFRGGGPRGYHEINYQGFDNYLLSLAISKGANVIRQRVTGVNKGEDHITVQANKNQEQRYNLLVVAMGVNSAAHKLFNGQQWQYRPPLTTKTAIREYYLGMETVTRLFGDSLHVYLLDIPRLDFAMIIPKGDYISVCMLGKDIDDDLIKAFMTSPEVIDCLPEGWRWDQPDCYCMPRINTRAAFRPYADRVVFVGDIGVTRLYKDGIGAAYRAAKAAAGCAVLQGIGLEDFKRHYSPLCKRLVRDNLYGRSLFFVSHILQHVRWFRRAMFRMVSREQRSADRNMLMSSVLWDTFTGSSPYREVFLRTIQPGFIRRLVSNLASSIIDG